MSTKTSIKRIALVAVSALGFGLLSVVPSQAVSGTGTAALAGPVRVSFTDGSRDAVPVQTFTFTNIAAEIADGANTALTMEVTQAPTTSATVLINLGGSENTSDTLGAAATAATTGANVLAAAIASGATDAAGSISISANAASGTYKGTFTLGDGTDEIVVSWSFTTTGKVATVSTDVSSVGLPAIAETNNTTPVVSKAVVVTLKDSAGNKTQPALGDTVGVSVADATNIGLRLASATTAAATKTLTNALLVTGSASFTVVSRTTTADSETVTIAPAGIMPAQGVANVTLTATTTGYGVETGLDTVLSSPTAASVVAAGTASDAEAAYLVDPSNTGYVFKVSGYTAGAAYKIQVLWTDAADANGTATVKDDTSNTTAASLTSGTASVLYGIAGATGVVNVTVTSTANNNTADTIKINPENATAGDYNDAADALVTNQSAAYAASITTPAVTPSMTTTGAAIAVAGKIADQYGNPLPGASVTVTGTVTTTDTTPANLTATATSAADGTWSVTLSAATALTTSVSIVASAAKTGTSVTNSAARVVNLTASGSPASMTYSDSVGDQDTATTLSPATTYPAARVAYAGVLAGITDETYTIATGAVSADTDPADVCVGFTATTTPGSQVTFTGTAGVKFSKTCAGTETLASATDSVTVASGTIAYAVATKVGLNTVTMTAGTVSKTANFWAANEGDGDVTGDAIRNLVADKTSLSLDAGAIGFITITANDAFGNAVKSAVAAGGATVTVKATGQALLDGPAISRAYTTTDIDGNIVVGVIAGQTAGSATVTIEGSGAQLGAAAGSATSTTAGTNGLTASVFKLTIPVTVVGNASDAATAAADAAAEAIDAANAATDAANLAAEAADAATVAAEEARDAADAATAAVEELATQVATLFAALKAQLTTLANTVAKISKKVRA